MSDLVRGCVLDHGYMELIETWGSDRRIIESARMSTGAGFKGWGPLKECKRCGFVLGENDDGSGRLVIDSPADACDVDLHDWKDPKKGDERLLRYLYENRHSTPFEMAGLTIQVKAPIFIFRQWHRHRTQSYNEMSARYTPLPNENYMPTVDRCLVVAGKNKQAGKAARADELTHEMALKWLEALADVYERAQNVYSFGLQIGIPKELARLPVPVGRYSVMRASANLRNWLAFMTLRCDADAQQEIQAFGWLLARFIKQSFPRTYELWGEGMEP